MEVKIQLYSLSLLILYLGSSVDGGDNSVINDDLGGVQYKTDDYEVTGNNQYKHQDCNACTYKNGKDPNIRKNIENIIKVLVKDYLPPAMETPTEQEHDIARDIQVAANKIIIQLALHASNITRKILKSMEIPNDSQVVIDTEMHNELIVNQNQIKKISELEDKISLLTENLTNIINVNNKQQSESIAIINNKITVLENLTSADSHEHRDMLGTIEKIQNSVMNLSETCQKVEEIDIKFTSFCDVKVPASAIPNSAMWQARQIPEKDYLDNYMINKTGCSYLATGYYAHHDLEAVPFSGQLEWRAAVRAREEVVMRLFWGSGPDYVFYVGCQYDEKLNLGSCFNDHVHEQFPRRTTPGALAEDRYVPLYIKIKNGKLTAGAECESEPWFRADFTVEKGQQLQRRLESSSLYGAKFLYDCPASFTGQ